MYTILAVEDDSIVRTTLQRVLRAEGYDVAAVATVKAGFKECARIKPDAVLLDVHLPDGNGVDLCRKLKSDPGLRHIPVLILTGDAVSLEDRTSGLDAGADDYLLKPFEPQELTLRLKRLLAPVRG